MSAAAMPYESTLVGYSPADRSYFEFSTGQLISEDDARELGGDGDRVYLGGFGNDLGQISAEQNQANLNAAAEQAAAQVGLNRENRGNWTQQQAGDFVQALRGIILENADQFTTDTVQVAQNLNPNPATYSGDAGRKLVDPVAITVLVTDSLNDVVEMLRPIAQTPSMVVAAANAVVNAADRAIRIVDRGTAALEGTSQLFPVLIPVAAVALVYFLARNSSRDLTRSFA